LLFSIHPRVLSGSRNPGNLGHKSLGMGSLSALWRDLIRALAERAIGFLFEELRELGPGERLGLYIIRI